VYFNVTVPPVLTTFVEVVSFKLIEFFDKEESVLNRLKFTLSLSTTGVKF
jgi:hypothetical protein